MPGNAIFGKLTYVNKFCWGLDSCELTYVNDVFCACKLTYVNVVLALLYWYIKKDKNRLSLFLCALV